MVNSQRLWELDVTVEAPSASEVYPSIQVYWGYPHGEWKKKPPLMVDYLGLYYLQMTWELSDIPKKRKLPCHLQSEKNRRMHKSRVICKVPRKKKNHMTWDLCNCLGSKNMQNMSCQLTHTLYTSHPT